MSRSIRGITRIPMEGGNNMDYEADDLAVARGILKGVAIGVVLLGLLAWGVWAWIR